jgi:hypothetical protein
VENVIPEQRAMALENRPQSNACDIRPLFLDVADTNVILER